MPLASPPMRDLVAPMHVSPRLTKHRPRASQTRRPNFLLSCKLRLTVPVINLKCRSSNRKYFIECELVPLILKVTLPSSRRRFLCADSIADALDPDRAQLHRGVRFRRRHLKRFLEFIAGQRATESKIDRFANIDACKVRHAAMTAMALISMR